MTKRRNTVEEEVSDVIASPHAKFKVDKALLFGSTAVTLIWLATPFNSPHVITLMECLRVNWTLWIPEFLWIALLFASGELDRRFKAQNRPTPRIIKLPLLILGIAVGLVWGWLIRDLVIDNLKIIFADPVTLQLVIVIVPVVCVLVILWEIRGGRDTMV